MAKISNEELILFPKYPILKLNNQEIENPNLAIDDFFNYVHLPEARDVLWIWFKATVTGDFPRGLKRKDRLDILTFFEYIQKLIEACHLINQENRRSRYSKKLHSGLTKRHRNLKKAGSINSLQKSQNAIPGDSTETYINTPSITNNKKVYDEEKNI